jgi:class 3 adenylate cyclase
MDFDIRFCKASDGVSIPCATMGEPVADDGDIVVASVQIAARGRARAEPGHVLAAGKGFLHGDVGDVVLKKFEDPVRLYEVRWEPL